MQHDWLGNPLSAAQSATLAAVDDFIGGYLGYETRIERIVAAADEAPDHCLANVYAGFLWMFLESPEAPERAGRYLDRAASSAARATPRERRHVEALRAWMAEDIDGAIRLFDAISGEFPRDLVAVKNHQYLEFNRGNSPAMLKVALKVLPANADVAYMHGMAAFAYEQCHLLEEAERCARAALELKRKEPWAQHALAHVMITQGRIDEGDAFLESVRDTWIDLNSFMVTHLWWHLALFRLSQGRSASVLEIYDRQVWGVVKQYSQDQIGAVSLLARLELAGIQVGDRWQDVADHLAIRAHDTTQPFLTLQYLYGLARAGRPEADTLLQAVRQRGVGAAAPASEVWRDVAWPAARGLHAHARGDFATAWLELGIALPRLIETGGSHAQRDLFEQVALDAAIRSGRLVIAQQRLEARRAADVHGVPVNDSLARIYTTLGLPTLATAAAGRAARTRARHGV